MDIYTQSGVYKLAWPGCKKAYVGQIGRSFAIQINKHKHAFRTTATNPNLLNSSLNKHTHLTPSTIQYKYHNGKTEEHTSTQLSTFYIYAEYTNNNHLNDDQTIFLNKIFDTLLKPHQP